MSTLTPAITTGLYTRALRAAANDVPRPGQVFACDEAQVTYLAHPAVTATVAAHLFYDTRPANTSGVRAPGWRVTCVVDPDLWAAAVDPLPVTWRPLLDYGDPGHLADVGPAGRLVLVRATQSVIAADRAERSAVIVSPNPAAAFVESYKTIRHLLTTQLLAGGASPLHASAVSVDGNILAFCGQKGSGKSSGLLHALLSRVPDLGYVANDRLLLRADHDTIQARCWPTVAGFGGTLLSSVPGLSQIIDPGIHLRGGGLAYILLDLPLVEQVGTCDAPGSTPTKIRLTPAEVAVTFGVPGCPTGRLALLVAVDLDPTRPGSALTEITDPADKASVLRANLETGIPTHPDWLGVTGAPASGSASDDLPRALSGVRVFRLIGGDDYHDLVRGLCGALRDPTFAADPTPSWHHGVYAAHVEGGALLTVHKSRGPYTGLLDLPGGSPNPGEDRDTALHREIAEETGARIGRTGPWHEFDLTVPRASDGRTLRLRHHGLWREVTLVGITAPTKTDEDVTGLHRLPIAGWRDREDLSAPLRAVLAHLTAPTGPRP